MPHHLWGDSWFKEHGNDLDLAISYCMQTWLKYGRIGSHGKEKYGSFRDHIHMFDGTLHSVIWPGYVRVMIPSWFYWNIDYRILRPLFYYMGIIRLVNKVQKIVYNYAVQQVCKKYPKIVNEIVADLDGYKFIKPGLFGNIDGEKIHNIYWTEY